MTKANTITVDGVTYTRQLEGDLRIVIADRGWVFVGHGIEDESGITMRGARVIRRWGTKHGLAQLANLGPQQDTVLEDPCTVHVPAGSIVAVLLCDEASWA